MRVCPRHLVNFRSCCARKGLRIFLEHLKTKHSSKWNCQASNHIARAPNSTWPSCSSALQSYWPSWLGLGPFILLRFVVYSSFCFVLSMFSSFSLLNWHQDKVILLN